jgi:hypothetical protein
MFALRSFFALALASVAYAANTNAAINTAVDNLDISLHHIGPTIRTFVL